MGLCRGGGLAAGGRRNECEKGTGRGYLRPHFSERELDRYEQEYLECCLIPEMEEKAVRKEEDYLPGPRPVARVLTGLSREYTIKIKTDREAGQRIIRGLQKMQVEISDPFNKLGGG